MSSFQPSIINTIFTDPFAPFIRGAENIRDGFNDNDLSLNIRIAMIVVGVLQLIPLINYIVYDLTKYLFAVKLADPSSLDVPIQRSIAQGNRQRVTEAKNLAGLVHKVAIDSFVDEIFRAGKLVPSKNSSSKGGIRTPVVFLQAMTQSMLNNPNVLQYRLLTDREKNMGLNLEDPLAEEANRRIALVFSLALLERNDYHASSGWNYGRMDSKFSFFTLSNRSILCSCPTE